MNNALEKGLFPQGQQPSCTACPPLTSQEEEPTLLAISGGHFSPLHTGASLQGDSQPDRAEWTKHWGLKGVAMLAMWLLGSTETGGQAAGLEVRLKPKKKTQTCFFSGKHLSKHPKSSQCPPITWHYGSTPRFSGDQQGQMSMEINHKRASRMASRGTGSAPCPGSTCGGAPILACPPEAPIIPYNFRETARPRLLSPH